MSDVYELVEPYKNRQEAGRDLARALTRYEGTDALILAVPRGGVVVAYEVAVSLGLDLDVIVPRKIGAPDQPELAIGAVSGWGNHRGIIDEQAVRYLGVTEDYLEREIAEQLAEAGRRLLAYRHSLEPPDVAGRGVIVIDDGIATGCTIRAGAAALRTLRAGRISLAVPVAPPDALPSLQPCFDEIVCLKTPQPFTAVGYWYRDFEQVSDAEVIALLESARARRLKREVQ